VHHLLQHCLFALAALTLVTGPVAAADPLPSWNEGAAKQRIVEFVAEVTNKAGRRYVPPEERIATFDNDGTLWSEQPLPFQLMFMLDQVKKAAAQHPEWKDNEAFRAIAAHDVQALARIGEKPVLRLLAEANSGMTTEAYDNAIREWLRTAREPRFKRPYTDLVYKPMRELLTYLRTNEFATFIVSGGSIEFMRPWAEGAYGVPPHQIVGTISAVRFELHDGQPRLVREPKIDFVDNGPGKPVGIYRSIGRQPIAAFGNSDGDLQMLQYTASGEGARLMLIVHHTDADREWAYDRDFRVSPLDKALAVAKDRGWIVVSMKSDWNKIFDFDP
jgi:hypothetical protein